MMPTKTDIIGFVGTRVPPLYGEVVRTLANLEQRSISNFVRLAISEYVESRVAQARTQIETAEHLQLYIAQERERAAKNPSILERVETDMAKMTSIRDKIDLEGEKETHRTYSGLNRRLKVAEKEKA